MSQNKSLSINFLKNGNFNLIFDDDCDGCDDAEDCVLTIKIDTIKRDFLKVPPFDIKPFEQKDFCDNDVLNIKLFEQKDFCDIDFVQIVQLSQFTIFLKIYKIVNQDFVGECKKLIDYFVNSPKSTNYVVFSKLIQDNTPICNFLYKLCCTFFANVNGIDKLFAYTNTSCYEKSLLYGFFECIDLINSNLFKPPNFFEFEKSVDDKKYNLVYIKSNLNEILEKKTLINGSFEMYMLSKMYASNAFFQFYKKKQFRPCFNLPAGFGKTFVINKLLTCFSKHSKFDGAVAAPTALGASLYENGYTIHRLLSINHAWEFSNGHFVLSFFKKNHYLIFDEFSMVPDFFINRLLTHLNKLHTDFYFMMCGDSSQMTPVKSGKIIDTDDLCNLNNSNFCVLTYTCQENIVLYRFKNCLYLNEFVHKLKIYIDTIKKRITNRQKVYNVNDGAFYMLWINYLKKIQYCDFPIDLQYIIDNMVEIQKSNNNVLIENPIFWTNNKNVDKPFGQKSFCDIEKVYANKLTRVPVCVAYENKISSIIQNSLFEKIDTFSILNKKNIKFYNTKNFDKNPTGCIFTTEIPTLIIDKKSFEKLNEKSLYSFLSKLPGNVGNGLNKINIGSSILCKKNHYPLSSTFTAAAAAAPSSTTSQKDFSTSNVALDTTAPFGESQNSFYTKSLLPNKSQICNLECDSKFLKNGDSGILVGVEVFNFDFSKCEIKNVDKYSILVYDHLGPENDTKPFEQTDFCDIQSEEMSIFWTIFDLNTKTLLQTSGFDKKYCAVCGNDMCKHHQSDFFIHAKVFYWQPLYSYTIYNLQGSTLSNIKVMVSEEHLFSTKDRLRTLYVLLSRIQNYEQLIVDKNFVKKSFEVLCLQGSRDRKYKNFTKYLD